MTDGFVNSTACLRHTMRAIVVCVSLVFSGNAHAWGLVEKGDSCNLVSENVSVIKDGVDIFGAAFAFQSHGEQASRSENGKLRYDLEPGILHLTFPDLMRAGFDAGDSVGFYVMNEYRTGTVMTQMRGLKKVYYFLVSGDSAQALLDALTKPSRMHHEAMRRKPVSSEGISEAMDLMYTTSLRLEAIARDGKVVRAEAPADWISEDLDVFNKCIEKIRSNDAATNDYQDRVVPKAGDNWKMIPLFGAHVRLPENCEIYEKESRSGKTMYVCDRHGPDRNVVESWITVGSVSQSGSRYLDGVKNRKPDRSVHCGMDIYSYFEGLSPIPKHFITDGKDFMILGDVDHENIPLIIQPVCGRRM